MSYLYQTPIKMPRGTHYGSDYWIAYSYKLKRMVHLYSMLEYANFITLEMNPSVEYFCEQPLEITDKNCSSKTASILDFWVQYINGETEFQEIKYSAELEGNNDASIRSQKQIEFQRNWCQTNGSNYRVLTENDLYKGQFLIQNLELLHSHLLRHRIENKKATENLRKILIKQNLTIGDMEAMHIFQEKYALSIVAYQYYIGHIELNIADRPLDDHTEVKLCEKKNIIS